MFFNTALNINFVGLALGFILIISFWIYVFIIFYHLVRFGMGTQPKKFAALFVLGTLILFFINGFLFMNIDWNVFTNLIPLS